MGYTYYVSFVDAYNRYTWIYFLKQKSETLAIFKQFQTMVELQLNHKIKSVQSDWGGEFRLFTQYLSSLGITHRLICPHTHHQNGVVERKHRYIVDIGLTLLSQVLLPLKFWDHAFHTTIYLINCLPSIFHNHIIPFQVIYNKMPDYTFLKVFGCACFPLIRPYNKHKLSVHFWDILLPTKATSAWTRMALYSYPRMSFFMNPNFHFLILNLCHLHQLLPPDYHLWALFHLMYPIYTHHPLFRFHLHIYTISHLFPLPYNMLPLHCLILT